MAFYAVCLALLLAGVLAVPAVQAAGTEESGRQRLNRDIPLDQLSQELQGVMGDMITIMGVLSGGLASSLEDGAQSIQRELDGADGVQLIDNKDDLDKFVELRLLRREKTGTGWKLTLAIRNTRDFPVRLINLRSGQSVLLIDSEGFAHELAPSATLARLITVPADAAVKAVFEFASLDGAEPASLRLYGRSIKVEEAEQKL